MGLACETVGFVVFATPLVKKMHVKRSTKVKRGYAHAPQGFASALAGASAKKVKRVGGGIGPEAIMHFRYLSFFTS